MPELPEVETLRRDLEDTLVGRAFTQVEVRLPKMFLTPSSGGAEDLIGRTILRLRRRAKFLLFELGERASLVFHLRMAGQLVHRDKNGATLAEGGHPVPAFGSALPHKSTHLIFRFDDASILYLTDIRQFGRVWFLPDAATGDQAPLAAIARLGPDPLEPDFTVQVLRERLARRPRALLKPLLLDQSFIGGVGNIYADEIIFESGLTPTTRAADIVGQRLKRLHAATRSVLDFAVREGVAEILNGKASALRDFPKVHGRSGQACQRCGAAILKTRFAGRSTYTCPRCQRSGVRRQRPRTGEKPDPAPEHRPPTHVHA